MKLYKTLKETITFYDDNTYSEFGFNPNTRKEKSTKCCLILIFRH